uniref:DNA-directed RNA polymerase subunit beta n=1 Tax=Spirodela intermedia TaxID=51605 RepID=A0A8S0X3V8_SPIIN
MLRDGNEGMFTIPGFSQIQFEGFCRFINQGLMEEFHKFPKIEDTDQEIEFKLFVETYQLAEPLIKERDAVYESLTYSSELYVLAGLIWKTNRDMKEQTVFIGNIPLMNSWEPLYPGIYYRSELDHNGISVYTSTIISDWGGRSELEIDRKARIWARVSRKQKSLFSKKKIGSKENAILEFYQQFACVGGDPVFSESLYVLAAADHLIGMKFGMGTLDDMNHLKNKRIRSVADLLQDQFGLALVRLENAVRGTISGAIRHKLIPTPQNLVTSTSLTTTYESFSAYTLYLNYLGPGGVTGRTASFRIRDIHPSHYGRICPIDTSEGINVGLIGSLAIHVRIGHWGSIESPFYEISERSKDKEARMVYLSPSRDEYYMVAAGNSLALNRGIQEEQVVPARYRQEFLTIAWEQVHLRSIFPFQYFSIGASLIPFIEHNDANRALMSSNMQRQAVPLSRSEKCIVGTGLERQAALDSGVSVIAEHEGKVISTDTHQIVFSGNGNTVNIPLVMYERSNKNTCMHQNLRFNGVNTLKGTNFSRWGGYCWWRTRFGKNVLVAYMPWEGYNFEDAVLISERLVYSDIYTSFHIRKYEIKTHMTSQGPERITNEIPHLEAHLLRNLDRNGIVMLGSWVETGDILVGKLTPQIANESSYAPEDRLLRAILGIQVSTAKETSLKLPIGGREMIRVYISQKREIKVGDKVAGRHGNKGIISKILPRQDMPYLQDGTPVDMVFNPLGVPSRMNVGQIFECSLGLAGDLLNRHYRIAPFDERYEQEASRKLVFSELYEASKQTKIHGYLNPNIQEKLMIKSMDVPVDIMHLLHNNPLEEGQNRGQRVGEMEVWALEGFGVAHILQEMLTYKSDHIRARQEVLGTTIIGGTIFNPEDAPESFRLLVRELRSLALELNHFLVSEKNFQINRKEA